MLARPTPAVPFTRRRRPPLPAATAISTPKPARAWNGSPQCRGSIYGLAFAGPAIESPLPGWATRNTLTHTWTTPRTPCRTLYSPTGTSVQCPLAGPVASVAYGHSHPQFEWRRDFGVTCHVGMYSENDVIAQNLANYNFSTADKSTTHSLQKSMYLVVPDRSKVSVYYKTPIGIWVTRDI